MLTSVFRGGRHWSAASRWFSAAALALVLGAGIARPVEAAEYRFNYISHSAAGQQFWSVVNRGMQDACTNLNVDCQMLFVDSDGNFQQILSNFQASVAQQVDGIVVTLINPDLLEESVKGTIEAGIPVVAANVDHAEGAKGSTRLSFIGQDLEQAGYDLAGEMAKSFPSGDVHVLVNGVDLAQAWAKQRSDGMVRFLEEWKGKSADRQITWEVIEATGESATEASRVAAYAQSHPNLSAALDVANAFPMAQAFSDLGYKPGQIWVGGFDLMPPVIEQMKLGYLQATVDQQPYLQGYLPILQLYLMKKFNLAAWDVNTGKAIVTAKGIDEVVKLSQDGVR